MDVLCGYFGALSDITRLEIMKLLTEHEMCVCELEDRLGMSQPAISHHLRALKKAGLISGRKSGKWTYYSLNGKTIVDNHTRFMDLVYRVVEDRVKNWLPASPAVDPENTYCATREKVKNKSIIS